MTNEHYILKDKKVVVVDDVLEWGKWFQKADRTVKKTNLLDGKRVSTVFLGLDHNFGQGDPLLFETMVFPPDSLSELDMDRYSTWDEAEKGHDKMVKKWSQL